MSETEEKITRAERPRRVAARALAKMRQAYKDELLKSYPDADVRKALSGWVWDHIRTAVLKPLNKRRSEGVG